MAIFLISTLYQKFSLMFYCFYLYCSYLEQNTNLNDFLEQSFWKPVDIGFELHGRENVISKCKISGLVIHLTNTFNMPGSVSVRQIKR